MKQLLEQSKQQLLNPLGNARRKLLIILNIVYCILTPFFLISEKIATGNFVNDSMLYLVYGTAIFCNALSAIYNIKILKHFRMALVVERSEEKYIYRNQKQLDLFFGYASVLPILIMSFFNLIGLGNPFNDSILTDFGLAQSLMIVVVIILGRTGATIWFLVVMCVLFWNVSKRGWSYEYHYSTPSEVTDYKKALENNKPWALERKAELEKNNLSPPKITRYFNVWIVIIIVSFLVAYFYSGITNDIFKIVPSVVDNIEQASEESNRMELEQKVNEEKTNTFINLAHETKTPLTLLNNYVDLYIKKHGQTEETDIIKWNLQRLTTDIVNFFDLERFNKGLSIYDHTLISNITNILVYKLFLFKSFAERKNIRIQEEIENNSFVLAHPVALERIINNLIENAVKFTGENGSIKVTLVTQGNNLRFSVADNGIGISSDLHGKIFEPYFQLSKEVKLNEGMGMGLSIVKRIVKDCNATITVNSQPSKGSEFVILFPRYELKEGEMPALYTVSTDITVPGIPKKATDQMTDPSRSFIMIVEDDPDMLNYLLENLGERYNVYVATNGLEALERLKSVKHLDLIISDVMMGGIDGLEFRKILTENDAFMHIPFIFLTAKTTAGDKLTGLKLGAIDYIEKPFLIDQLVLKVEAVLQNLKEQRAAVIHQAYNSILQNRSSPVALNELEGYTNQLEKADLTRREIQVIELMLTGIPYKEIASSLYISEKTVARHVSKILEKFTVNSRVELINKLRPVKFTPSASGTKKNMNLGRNTHKNG